MCNLYALMKTQAALIALIRAMYDLTGNLPPLHEIFPDRWRRSLPAALTAARCG